MDERQMWLEAVNAFRKDINSIVKCPSCKEGYLAVMDVAFDDTDIMKGGERYLECSHCDRVEIVLYRTPPENWFDKSSKPKEE